MAKERFLTILTPIKDSDCEATVYADAAALATAVPPSVENINKVYKLQDGTYMRVWLNPSTSQYEYHSVTDREFPYLGDPLQIFDFTYDATRMGTAPTITAQAMRYAEKDQNGNDVTLEGLWTQQCHVVFNGENMYLKQIPSSSKSNEDARYKYDLTFVAERVVLEGVYFYDVVSPFITEKPVSESPTFSFYGDINELAKRINASLIRSGLASLTRKYVHYDDPYYEEVLPSTLVPYLTYEQWSLINTNPHSLVPEVFGSDYEWQVFRYEIYRPLNGDYNRYLMDYIYENENGVYTLTGYQCKIGTDEYGDTTTSEEKIVSFEQNTIYEALQQFKETFELYYYITKERDDNGNFTGNTFIVIGDCEHDFADWNDDSQDFVRNDEGIPTTENPFDYGSENELLSKEKNNTTDKIVTRITGVGSADNIPWYYPNPGPDGWISPFYTRFGSRLENCTIDYPTEEGSTVDDAKRYENFLKNRISVPIKRGLLTDVIYNKGYAFCVGQESDGNMHFMVKYQFDTRQYTLIQQPRITLSLDYHPIESGCSKVVASLTRDTVVIRQYDSSETYQDPTDFQELFMYPDGKHKMVLASGYNYHIDIDYVVPSESLPLSKIYDIEGYHYPSVIIHEPESSNPLQAHVGEDFYSYEGLTAFGYWGQHTSVFSPPIDAGYSFDGTRSGKVSPIPREKGKQYKDLATGIIYRCKTSEGNNIENGKPTEVFSESPSIEAAEWISEYVNMELRVFINDGWYVNNKKVDLNDYGLAEPIIPYADMPHDIFDTIEFQRVKWVTTIPNLMPEVFIKTDGERRFYNAHNYWDAENETLLVGTADTTIGEVQVDDKVRNPIYKEEETDTDDKHYEFENEYIQQLPHEHIEDLEDIKPTIEGQRNYVAVTISEDIIEDWANQYQNYFTYDAENGVFVNATSTYDASETYYMLLRIDVVEAFAYDETDNDEIWESSEEGSIEGEYKHPYFFAKLRPMGFNIFDLALQEDMVISMTTGHCGACNFKIGVDEKTKKNPVQIWMYDVYKGADPNYATKVYDKGTLRRYCDTTDLYYDTDDGFVPIDSGLTILGNSGQQIEGFLSSVPAYYRYKYSTDDVKNGFVGSFNGEGNVHFEGDVVTSGRFIDSQQDTSQNYVWVALMKDTESYGVIMPSAKPNYNDENYNVYIRPSSVEDVHVDEDQEQGIEESTMEQDEENADKFVILNIKMPQVYIRRAEHKLSRQLVKYMYEHNVQKFNFSIKFSRIYLAQNTGTDENLNENSVLYVLFNNKIYRQYAKHYTYKMAHGVALPEISVDMNEELSVSRTIMQQWDERMKRSGKAIAGRFGSALSHAQDRIGRTTISRSADTILSGNVIINDTNTSLVELGSGGGQGVEANAIPLDTIEEITSN